MTITEIADKGRGRYIIYLNDAPAFVLKGSEIRQYKLREGEVLDEDLYLRILEEVLIKRAKSRALYILDGQDKTEKELRERLKKDLYPDEVVDAAVEAAKKGKYLDDTRYASQYIYEKSGKKSRKQIRLFLEGKGIERSVIDAAFENADAENGEKGEDPEADLIGRLIDRRCPDVSGLDPIEEQKLIRFLMGKGFQYEKIRRELERRSKA